MSCGSTACCTPVTILAIQIHEKDQQQRLNKNSCMDLSRKRKCNFIRCCNFHISYEVIMYHEVAESNENEDIVLHNYEMETTHYSEKRLCVCEACLFHTDKQHDFKGVSDSVCIFHVLLKTSNGGKYLHQKKVVGGKERRRGSMDAESRYAQHKIKHYSLIGESTLQHDRKRHPKKGCLVKCYYMFTLRMFLIALINLKIPLKAPKTSNGKRCIDGEVSGKATKEELFLDIWVKTKILLQFYLCGSDVGNGKAKTVLHSGTNQNMIYIREMATALFGEDFEEVPHNELSVPQCGAMGDNLLCCSERRLGIAPHNGLSGDSSVETENNVLLNGLSRNHSVETDKNFLHNDLSGDHSVETDKNVLHNDLPGDHSVETDKNVLHNDLSGDHSVETDKNVLHNDLSGDHSVETDKNVLHNDLSGDHSVETDKNVLHNDLPGDHSVETDKNVLHNDLPGDHSVETDKNVLHNDLPGDCLETDKNILHNDLPGDHSVETDKNILHNDLPGDHSVETDKNILHNDLPGDHSVETDKNVLHNDLPGDHSVETDKNVLHNDLSGDHSVETVKNVLHNDLPGDHSVETDKNVLHNDLSGDHSVETDKNVLHNDLSGDHSVETDKNDLHNDLPGDHSVETDKNVLHNDLPGDHSVERDKNVLHNDVSGDHSVETDKNVLHNDLPGDHSVERDKNVLHNDLPGDHSVETDKNVLHNDLPGDHSVETDKNVLPNYLSGDHSVERDKNVLHNDLPGDHSVETDKNVLHNDLPGDRSVETDKNVLHNDFCGNGFVLHNDLSVESPVKTDNNVVHNDVSGNNSFETVENVLDNDLLGDSSVEVDKNVLHNDLSVDSSVEVNKNVLHNDLSGDSSVEVDKNVLHNDLSGDHSVEIDKNVLHNDLLGDSPVEVDKNLLPNDLSADNCVKIYGHDLHYDLLEDSSKSVKISKNDFHDVTFEVSSIKTSRPMYNIKLNKNNTHQIKVTDNVDYIRSCMDMLGVLGIYPRCSHSLPIFWQEITLYPFTRHVNNLHGDLHQLMRYEVFRLCSFSYARFPANCDVWVTHLAQAGFYCENENGRIICFHCGREFRGSVGSSVEDGHHPECDYHEHSRPLHVWTEGLNQEVLAIYYNRYGSLRPYNFEVSSQQSLSDHPDSAHGSGQGSAVAEPQPQRYSEQASGDTAVAREPETPVLAEVNREDSVIVEAARPEYHSMALPSDPGGGSRDHEFGDQAQSLPGNLNEVSGAVVSEESQDTPGSYQILTSAATNPMPFYSSAARGSQSQADNGTEQGAVGGAGVTLDLSKASYPLFSSAEARRQTYTAWSPTHSHRPEDLAAAGFFYAGYADCVRCFCCGLGLKFWRQADIPAYQHARYRPHCVYNRLYKGQDYVDRVQQDLRSEQGITDQLVEALPPAQDALTVATRPRPGRVQDEEAPATGTPLVTEAPRVPDLMNSEVAQTAMRNGWQRHQVQQAVDHIIQEFNVRSLEIGLLLDVLANLNQDEPERNLPSGGSVGSADSGVNDPPGPPSSAAADDVNEVLIGGVSNVQREIDVADAIHGEEAAAEPRAVPIQQPSVPPIEFNELFRSVEREHALLSERTTCRVCRRQPVSCIYLPCGHVIACQDCADIATHCILCTRQIIGTANIFLA